MFVDEVIVELIAGRGGDGCMAFRREKYIPMGGPFGGSGGKGSDIIFKTDEGLRTLIDLRYKKIVKGTPGSNGQGKNKNGKNAEDIIIKVPIGTTIKDAETGVVIADLIKIGGKIGDDETTLKMLWRKADGQDVNMGNMFWRVEDSPFGIYLGFYDGFVEPLGFSYSSSYSAEAIFIMDDMSESIWKKVPSVLPLLDLLDPDEIKKRQENFLNQRN